MVAWVNNHLYFLLADRYTSVKCTHRKKSSFELFVARILSSNSASSAFHISLSERIILKNSYVWLWAWRGFVSGTEGRGGDQPWFLSVFAFLKIKTVFWDQMAWSHENEQSQATRQRLLSSAPPHRLTLVRIIGRLPFSIWSMSGDSLEGKSGERAGFQIEGMLFSTQRDKLAGVLGNSWG